MKFILSISNNNVIAFPNKFGRNASVLEKEASAFVKETRTISNMPETKQKFDKLLSAWNLYQEIDNLPAKDANNRLYSLFDDLYDLFFMNEQFLLNFQGNTLSATGKRQLKALKEFLID